MKQLGASLVETPQHGDLISTQGLDGGKEEDSNEKAAGSRHSYSTTLTAQGSNTSPEQFLKEAEDKKAQEEVPLAEASLEGLHLALTQQAQPLRSWAHALPFLHPDHRPFPTIRLTPGCQTPEAHCE